MTGLLALRDLSRSRTEADQLQQHLVDYDIAAAKRDLRDLQDAASGAHARTHDPVWWVAGHLPRIGRPFAVARGLGKASDDLARRALPPALVAAEDVGPAKIRDAQGRVDVRAVGAAASAAKSSAAAAAAVRDDLDRLPRAGIEAIDTRTAKARAQIDKVSAKLSDLSRMAQVLPPLLGSEGKRTYFVVFQNNAEVRGTGGLPGAFAVVSADHGEIHLERVGSDNDITLRKPVPLPWGKDFVDRYVALASDRLFVNANMTPHFPYAAQIFQSMWQQVSGQRVDGVLALDPIAQSYLLPPGTQIPVPGKPVKLNADNFVSYVESAIYSDFPNVPRRKAVLAEIAGSAFSTVIKGGGDSKLTVSGLRRAASEHRLLMWSAHPEEQKVLDTTEVGGFLPEQTGPYAQVVLNNVAGSKLDYYIKTDVKYEAGPCTGKFRKSTLTMTVTNTAPAHGLPPYVTIRADRIVYAPMPVGSEHLYVSAYVTPRARLMDVHVNGRQDGVYPEVERNHPVYTADVDIAPGHRSVIVLSMSEPVVPGEAQVVLQPAVLPGTATVDVPTC